MFSVAASFLLKLWRSSKRYTSEFSCFVDLIFMKAQAKNPAVAEGNYEMRSRYSSQQSPGLYVMNRLQP